jgi:hypothetical protein
MMLTPLLLDIGPIPPPPEFALLVLVATVGAAMVLMVTRMVTGEQT